MADFVLVARVHELSDPGRKLLEIDERLLVLFRIGDEFFCLDDVCSHDGGPLGEGRLDGYEIACPRHGARFDVRTGLAKTMPATENTGSYCVKVEGDQIFVSLDAAAESGSAAPNGSLAAPLPAERDTAPMTANAAAAAAPAVAADCGCDSPAAATAAAASKSAVSAAAACSGEPHGLVIMGPLTEDRVREELKRVVDPELFVNIVDLGLIYVVDLQPAESGKTNVRIEMTMTSPMCPAGPQLIGQSKQFVSNLPQVAHVEVKVVMDPPWSPDKMTDAARDQLGIF